MTENICKWWDQPGVNTQNIQTGYTTQYWKKQSNQKMGRRPKQTFLQWRQSDGQQAHGKEGNY